MNKQKLEAMATSAFENVRAARSVLFTTAENTIEAQASLEADKAAAITAGKFDGKNAETREAQAHEYLSAQFDAVSECSRDERRARFQFDTAQIDLDTVKTLLRIAELAE